MNYNNYINDLRINYIIDQLYNNVTFQEYKISYLAEHCGFASREVFAIAFKKQTGITPSSFINRLKSENQPLNTSDSDTTKKDNTVGKIQNTGGLDQTELDA